MAASGAVEALSGDVGVVIDEELLRSAIDEEAEATKRDDVDLSKYDKPEMKEVETLALSFKNVYQIDNLVGFENLVTLRLDNNTISRIENIAHLVNLKWLDLSFNNIKKIEGLETLTKLTDLSLYNNAITAIDGLDSCKGLQCLSLGNNEIRSTEHIMYLRQFTELNLVNMDGNPVCEDPDYRTVCLAYLKPLKYLDYEMVDPSEVQRAKELCQDDLLELEEKEGIEALAYERDATRDAVLEELSAANIEVAETLFEDLLKEDAEMPRLRVLPGLQDLLEEFRERYKAAAEAFKQLGMEKHAEMEKEVQAARAGLQAAANENASKGVELVQRYAKLAKHTFRALHARGDVEMSDLEQLKKANSALGAELTELEMHCVEQCLAIIDTFETHFGELKSNMLDIHQTFFRAVEEYENEYFDALLTLSEDLQKKLADGIMPDISEELNSLLQDREGLNNSMGQSHDGHISRILAFEDEARDKENARFKTTFESLQESEKERNRERVLEIAAIMERNLKAMHDEFVDEYGEEDEFA
eukprot:CAMPEP_0203819972 /NCGR_PEP_ID=MMETSP0115-20131106/38108_1 /ASSEMBLY_ACC=CAM_ASM_000227 /TAXON_ID=33651 /ORGANISM="Bicosoecid sp, Strain ms1" /LENGTH=530 /DNA_ID=CAMNT_0050728969 /DNA_START=179 /DNA_END=1771 /DNA_ORIENTATION=+